MEPTRKYTHLTNRVTSQCELMTIFLFRHAKLADTFSLTPCGRDSLKRIPQIFRPDRGLNPGPFYHLSCVLPWTYSPASYELLSFLYFSILRSNLDMNSTCTVYFKLKQNKIIPKPVLRVLTALHFSKLKNSKTVLFAFCVPEKSFLEDLNLQFVLKMVIADDN